MCLNIIYNIIILLVLFKGLIRGKDKEKDGLLGFWIFLVNYCMVWESEFRVGI